MVEKAGGYETFTSTTTYATRQKMQVRWKDALKRAFELAKFDPRHKEDEKPKLLKKPRFIKVSAIKPEQKGLNLQLKVVKLPEVVEGEKQHEVICGDDTGTVTLNLTPSQFLPCEAGKYIRVQNAKVRMNSGYIRIEVDKWGKVSSAETPEATFDVNLKNDVSAIEYELK